MAAKFALGIDIGTTTVKAALVDLKSNEVVATKSRETHGSVPSQIGNNGNEQDVSRILTALQFCVSGLPKESLTRIGKIGICGQMHGVMLWKKSSGWSRNEFGRFDVGEASQLYTWQDGRCSPQFLASLPQPKSHLRVSTGFGCATIFWLVKNQPDMIGKYSCAGTIQDYVVAMLCGLDDKPVMSAQNAASWGFYDCISKSWNEDRLNAAGFPVDLLPLVLDSGQAAGKIASPWYGIPGGTPVSAALGDLQCSFLSCLPSVTDAVLNISTSAQLAFQMNEDFTPPLIGEGTQAIPTIDYFPFFNNRYLAVAASLTGGNVMAAFVKMLQQWTHELGLGVPKAKIWEKLHSLGMDSPDTDLVINPTIFGERHSPTQQASVTNIGPQNLALGSVYLALCKGFITNLHGMMGQDFLMSAGVQRIVGSGTGMVRNEVMRKQVEEQYSLPLVISEGSEADAAVGAAFAVITYL